MSKKLLATLLIVTTVSLLTPSISPAYAANPSSSNYTIQDYTFGSGGTTDSTSTNYGLYGVVGQVEFGTTSSTNFTVESGLIYAMKVNVPPAPTFTNANNTYDRLRFIVNTGGNTATTTYALQISTDPTFTTNIYYVKNDNTIGTTLSPSDFQTYTAWGGATGEDVTGLTQNTTYYLRVKARQTGNSETGYGPAASATTSVPSLTFSVNQDTITFDNLNGSNAYTDSSKSTQVTTSTNALNGYIVTARSTGPLTGSSATIPDYASTNASPTTWSGFGFGYTTNDASLTGGTTDRFTNGGPKYAGFTTSLQGDPVADHPGPVTTPITNESHTISYRVQTSSSQKAAKYTTTVLYIVVPNY